jgi:hypothetical protein
MKTFKYDFGITIPGTLKIKILGSYLSGENKRDISVKYSVPLLRVHTILFKSGFLSS